MVLTMPFMAFTTKQSGQLTESKSTSGNYSSVRSNRSSSSFSDTLQKASNRTRNTDIAVHDAVDTVKRNEINYSDDKCSEIKENNSTAQDISNKTGKEKISATVGQEQQKSTKTSDDWQDKLGLLLQMLGFTFQSDNQNTGLDGLNPTNAGVLTEVTGQESPLTYLKTLLSSFDGNHSDVLTQDALKVLQGLVQALEQGSGQESTQNSGLKNVLNNLIVQIQSMGGSAKISPQEFINRLDEAIKKALAGTEDSAHALSNISSNTNENNAVSNLNNANKPQGDNQGLSQHLQMKNESGKQQSVEINNTVDVDANADNKDIKSHSSGHQVSMGSDNGEKSSESKASSVGSNTANHVYKTSETQNQIAARQYFALELKQNAGLENVNKTEQTQLPRMAQNIFSQIVQKAKLINEPGLSEMSIQLKPNFLGKLNLNISVENGTVTAKFDAENHQVKAIIEANLNTLRDALSNQGVKVDQLVVNVGSEKNYSGFQGRENQNTSPNLSRKNSNTLAVNDSFEYGLSGDAKASVIADYYGSNVNLTA